MKSVELARASLSVAVAHARNAHEAAQIKARIERIGLKSSHLLLMNDKSKEANPDGV